MNTLILIDWQCPQCGAPMVLEETDLLIQCGYCRVKSYLLPETYFQYLLPHNASADERLIWFPYWRFKGMSFSCGVSGIRHQFIDMSFQAISSSYFPYSLGLRSQAMHLRFVSPDAKGIFLTPDIPITRVMELVKTRFVGSEPLYEQAFIGETISLIYAPFYVKDRVYDAVLNQPVSSPLPVEGFNISGTQPDWELRFVATLCPKCGWDLTGERDALALVCENCQSIWRASDRKLKAVNAAAIPGKPESCYLPFWKIKAEVNGWDLNSYADMVKAVNVRMVQDGWEDMDFYFWVPAFKISPQLFMRIATNMTVSQPQQEFISSLPHGRLFPVTLPASEAYQCLKLIAAGFVQPRKQFREQLGAIRIHPKTCQLVFVPFDEVHHEYIQPMFQLAVNKNMLTFSKNL